MYEGLGFMFKCFGIASILFVFLWAFVNVVRASLWSKMAPHTTLVERNELDNTAMKRGVH